MIITTKNITPENIDRYGVFCIKDKKSPGRKKKIAWFRSQYIEGLKLKIAIDENQKQLGFIEYIPGEKAWRPIIANGFLFIQCIAIFVKDAKGKGIASGMIKEVEKEAMNSQKDGVCTICSEGVWMAGKSLYEKNGYTLVDTSDRYTLWAKAFSHKVTNPSFPDWGQHTNKYKGWHLIYSDQCPWHEKSVNDIRQCAEDQNINMKFNKINSTHEAQLSPTGFGTYSLIKDGNVLADHYISLTKFKNILAIEKGNKKG